MEFVTNNSLSQVGSKIFRQVTGIPAVSDPAPFFANLLFFYDSGWLKSIKILTMGLQEILAIFLRFIDDLIVINDRKEFENHYNEIYPPKLILKKENTLHTETTLLDLHLCINEGQIQTSLYDKRNSYNFNVMRIPYKSSITPSKMFFATISAQILRIRRATSSVVLFNQTSQVFLHRMLRQGQILLALKSY